RSGHRTDESNGFIRYAGNQKDGCGIRSQKRMNTEPNQSLQTMTTAVTCRAAHAPRQLRSCLILSVRQKEIKNRAYHGWNVRRGLSRMRSVGFTPPPSWRKLVRHCIFYHSRNRPRRSHEKKDLGWVHHPPFPVFFRLYHSLSYQQGLPVMGWHL